jgi:hypothetical protein
MSLFPPEHQQPRETKGGTNDSATIPGPDDVDVGMDGP